MFSHCCYTSTSVTITATGFSLSALFQLSQMAVKFAHSDSVFMHIYCVPLKTLDTTAASCMLIRTLVMSCCLELYCLVYCWLLNCTKPNCQKNPNIESCSWVMQQKSVPFPIRRLRVWILMIPQPSVAWRHALLSITPTLANHRTSEGSLCWRRWTACSCECVAWAAVWKDMVVSWFHVSWRKHILDFTVCSWYLSYDRELAGG